MTKDITLHLRMDKNLYKQLKRYADKNDESIASVSARKAIAKFLLEEEIKNEYSK